MDKLRKDDAAKAARQIISYFLRNPLAADTMSGIARWRLLDERIYQNMQAVQEALDWLVSQGLLLAENSSISDAVYRLDTSKSAEAEHFLARGLRRGRLRMAHPTDRSPHRR